jgi:transmembrane sensor
VNYKSIKEELLRKYVNNECSTEEIELLFEYLHTSQADPHLHAIISEEMQKLNGPQELPSEQVSAEMYRVIEQRIQKKNIAASPSHTRRLHFSYSWRIAAVFIGILMSSVLAYYLLKKREEVVSYTTGYGQTAKITLPDSSVVTLNGNSSLTYISGWNAEIPREVWLKGEAFFSVTHTRNHQKFKVNTSDRFSVEVLGTEFNVYNRSTKTQVVLKSGKVTLNVEEPAKQNRITMQPGELVEFKDNPSQFVKRGVNAEVYSSWINKKLILDNTSFREIASLLEETYGLSVVVPNESLYQERFSGIVPCENAGMLLNALALSFNLTVQKKGNQVRFQTK